MAINLGRTYVGRSIEALKECIHDILPDLLRLAFLTPEGHAILVSICIDARTLLKRMSDSKPQNSLLHALA